KFGDRLRTRLERYRTHPVRYFLLVGLVLGLLVTAAVVYVALDADKRASERALANLQFCHLALRSATDNDHLKKIQATEKEIRALIAKLPAADQRKARNIADQLAKDAAQPDADAKGSDSGCAAKLDAVAKDIAAIRAQLDRSANHDAGSDEPPAPPDAARVSPDGQAVDAGP